MALSAKHNIPDLPPFKLITVLRHYTYLWPYTARVRFGRVTRVRDKQSAGKILGGGATGLVVWRDEFIAKYPELRGYNVYREEVESGSAATSVHYELVFKPREGEAEVNSFQTQQYYQAGATYSLDQMQQASPLLSALNHTFAPNYTGDKLLSLAYFSLMTGSLAFHDFLFFQADTRLPYPDALTERDINNLLSTVSDVDLAQFNHELALRSARRLNRKSHLYALQVNLPHNLMTKLTTGQVKLYSNQADLDQVIARDVHNHRWQWREQVELLKRFSASQDDCALILFNGSTGQTFGFHPFNSEDFSLRELAEFLTNSARPQRPEHELNLSPEQSEFAQALKNTKELEQKTGYVDLSKPDRLARTRALNHSIELIGALSPTGYEAQALKGTDVLTHSDPNARRSALLGAQRTGTALALSAQSTTALMTADGLITKPPLVRTPQNQSDTRRAPTNQHREEPAPVVLVRTAPHDLIATLRHYNQQSQPVLLDLPLSHPVARYLKRHALEQLLELGHYDHERQRFTLTIRLPHRFPEYDLSTKYEHARRDSALQASVERPKQLPYELVIHLVLDLEPLLAASAHTKAQRQAQEEALAAEEEGFEDTVFEQETKQGTVRLSATQAKKLAAIDLDPATLLEELPQASFWQGQDSIKTHTYAPLRELDQDDLDLIDDVSEALARLGEETTDSRRTTSMGSSVVNAWRNFSFDPLDPFAAAPTAPDPATSPTSRAQQTASTQQAASAQQAARTQQAPAAPQAASAPKAESLRRTSTRLTTPSAVKPLEGQILPETPPATEAQVQPVPNPEPQGQKPSFFEREAARLKAAGRGNVAANQASDAERLALLMASMPGQPTAQPSPQPTGDWLPLDEAEPETDSTTVAIEQIGAEPFIPGQEQIAAEPTAEPTAENPTATSTEQDISYDPEEERQAEELAATLLDEADLAHTRTQKATAVAHPETASSTESKGPSAETTPEPNLSKSTAEDDALDFLNWDETAPRRPRAHITADNFFDLDDEPVLEHTPARAAQAHPHTVPAETVTAAHSTEHPSAQAASGPQPAHTEDLDFLDFDETKPRPKRQTVRAEDFFDLDAELNDPAQSTGAPDEVPEPLTTGTNVKPADKAKAQSLEEMLEARREAKRRKLDQFFDFEEEEHEEVGRSTDHNSEPSREEQPWAKSDQAAEALVRTLQASLEPEEMFDLTEFEQSSGTEFERSSGAAFEVPSDQLEGTDAPLVRAKPKTLGALATLAAAAEERRTQRAERVLTASQKKRLQRDLKALIDHDLTESLGCLRIMISNQVTDVNEAYSTVKSLNVATDYLDLMCYDVYKVERALLNPMALALKPRLQQLLRGKNFVLFYALSLHLMLKHLFERKDAEQGGRALRHRMGLYEVSDLLQALNHVSAARRDEGLFYPDLKMHYRSLFELAGVAPPSFEAYDDSVSEQFVHLRRSNTGR